MRRTSLLDDTARARLAALLDDNAALRTVHEYREQLERMWEQANLSNERAVAHLREWCAEAEASGIKALQDFAATLRGYVPQRA